MDTAFFPALRCIPQKAMARNSFNDPTKTFDFWFGRESRRPPVFIMIFGIFLTSSPTPRPPTSGCEKKFGRLSTLQHRPKTLYLQPGIDLGQLWIYHLLNRGTIFVTPCGTEGLGGRPPPQMVPDHLIRSQKSILDSFGTFQFFYPRYPFLDPQSPPSAHPPQPGGTEGVVRPPTPPKWSRNTLFAARNRFGIVLELSIFTPKDPLSTLSNPKTPWPGGHGPRVFLTFFSTDLPRAPSSWSWDRFHRSPARTK